MAAAVFIGFFSSGAAEADGTSSADSRALVVNVTAPEKCPAARKGVAFYRAAYLRHRARMGAGRPSTPAGLTPACSHARSAVEIWRSRALVARKAAEYIAVIRRARLVQVRRERRALYEKWRCIHEHEGAWDANTGNGYYGGLQMDLTFQRSHGLHFYETWGTADRWPVWAQIEAAEDAYKTRGFSPWPNTSRMCGLR